MNSWPTHATAFTSRLSARFDCFTDRTCSIGAALSRQQPDLRRLDADFNEGARQELDIATVVRLVGDDIDALHIDAITYELAEKFAVCDAALHPDLIGAAGAVRRCKG